MVGWENQIQAHCHNSMHGANRPSYRRSFVSHTFFLEGGGAKIRMVTIGSFLEIITILGQDSGRANEITDPQNCTKSHVTSKYPLTTVDVRVLHMAIEMLAACCTASLASFPWPSAVPIFRAFSFPA